MIHHLRTMNTQSPLPQATPDITDKRGYAARWHFSVRTIDALLAKGLPHCKVGKRRVRLVVSEADAWMHEQFQTQRRAA
jgi:hypothetical protein